jgi:hypothetical protein
VVGGSGRVAVAKKELCDAAYHDIPFGTRSLERTSWNRCTSLRSLSLYVADRGEKAYLREAWSGREFDLASACRRWGRNDAVWVLCYRRWLAGEDLPSGAELRAIVRAAGRATGGIDASGRRRSYTLYEARATVEQVSCYDSHGLAPLLVRGRGKTVLEQALLDALRSVARASARHTFTASYRQLSALSGVPLVRIAEVAARLQRRRLVWRTGETAPVDGHEHGTTIWSLRPPRPAQRMDEVRPPAYDARRCRWVWSTPSDRGRITPWLFRRAARALEGRVPNVQITPFDTYLINLFNSSRATKGPPGVFFLTS